MNSKISKTVNKDSGKFTINVDPNLFMVTGNDTSASRPKYDKKYNLRIRQEDLYLLDALAEEKSAPRSILLNHLLHEILLEDLMKIQELDVRLLLAETADRRSQLDAMSQPWAVDAMQTENQTIMENVRLYNRAVLDIQEDKNAPADHLWNTKQYHVVKNNLESMDK